MELTKRKLPPWCKSAKKALIDRDMTVTELAKDLDYSREHVSAVINDKVRSPITQERICSYLGISAANA